MLAWFVGKLKAWTDNYPWTPDEVIHWVLIHYQGSPSAAMQIYREAEAVLNEKPTSMLGRYISQPVGGSLFPKEVRLDTYLSLNIILIVPALALSPPLDGGNL